MGISIREFEVAMETYGATRMKDRYGSRFRILVPCFQLEMVCFYKKRSKNEKNRIYNWKICTIT